MENANAKNDRRRIRRALLPVEFHRLLEATRVGPEHYGLSGYARALCYYFAANTGLRSREVGSVTWSCLDFGPSPTVTLAGAKTKNRKRVVQPIRPDLAAELSRWRQNRSDEPDDSVVWVLPKHVDGSFKTAVHVKADLEAVGVPYESEDGVADFHALRASYETWMLAKGASRYGVQKLMRHASERMTATYE